MNKQCLKVICIAPILLAAFGCTSACAQDSEPCLEYAYPKGQGPGAEAQFDTRYDDISGTSFSCGPAIAASKARDALESFRYGVLYHDKVRIDAALRFPLTVRINKTLEGSKKSEVVIIHNTDEWAALQKDRMTDIQVGVIACSWLGNVKVISGYSSPGFYIGGGLVWFQRIHGSAKVKVTSLNLMPLTKEMQISYCVP
jgi:hypothetical protein